MHSLLTDRVATAARAVTRGGAAMGRPESSQSVSSDPSGDPGHRTTRLVDVRLNKACSID